MNHTKATPAEIEQARKTIYRAAVRAGYDRSTADDIAQNAMERILFYAYPDRCPASIGRAAAWTVATARRYGWRQHLPAHQRPRGRAADETARAVELATMAVYRERSGNLTPAQMAERAEGLAPLDEILASQGVGPTALVHEAGHTPSLYGTGQPQRPPRRGAKGLHTDTDPVPGSHARAAEECRRHAAAVAAG